MKHNETNSKMAIDTASSRGIGELRGAMQGRVVSRGDADYVHTKSRSSERSSIAVMQFLITTNQ